MSRSASVRGRRPFGGLRLPLALAAAAALVAGCGGGTGDLAAKPESSPRGRVVLGALGDATVAVYRVGRYDAPVATATTSTGATAAETGGFSFDLPEAPPDALFLLVASGGVAHDRDEDGVLDGPTPNLGTVHALATAAQIRGREVRLSAVTEVVYRRVRYLLEALYDESLVARACDAWASFVLRANLAGHPAIDNEDALAFDPALHADRTYRPYARYVAFVDHLLSAAEDTTAEAFDLSREEVAFQDLEGRCRGIDVAGSLACVCRGQDGLALWDVSDPALPRWVGGVDTPGFALNVQVVGTLAYVADVAGDLQIVDVSDPAAPRIANGVATSGQVSDLHVVGNLAYLVSWDGAVPRIHVADVTTPEGAEVIGEIPVGAGANRVRVHGSHAYVVQHGRIETVDVSDPAHPVSLGAFDIDRYATADVASGHLFVASDARLEVFSLATPEAPVSVGSLPLNGNVSSSVRVRGTQALVARGPYGLALVDVADPALPRLLGVLPTTGRSADVARIGGLYVLTETDGGLSLLASGTPPPSAVVASVPLGESVEAVEASGNLVFAASAAPDELVVLDVSDPLAPARLGGVPLRQGPGLDVLLHGNLALVAERAGLEVYDVANPAAPAFVDGDGTIPSLQGLAALGDTVYAGANSVFGVYDVATPSDPHRVATIFSTSHQARDVDAAGSTVALAEGDDVVFYDATDPAAPVEAGRIALPYAYDVLLRPPFAFVPQWSATTAADRLTVVDWSDRAAPTPVAHVDLPSSADRLVRSGDLLYVSGWAEGIHVVDVSAPTAPVLVGTAPVPGTVTDLDVEGDFLYAAGGHPDGRLLVLRAARAVVP